MCLWLKREQSISRVCKLKWGIPDLSKFAKVFFFRSFASHPHRSGRHLLCLSHWMIAADCLAPCCISINIFIVHSFWFRWTSMFFFFSLLINGNRLPEGASQASKKRDDKNNENLMRPDKVNSAKLWGVSLSTICYPRCIFILVASLSPLHLDPCGILILVACWSLLLLDPCCI